MDTPLPAGLFPSMSLPPEVVLSLRNLNPWWEGKPGKIQPATRRHLVAAIHKRLERKLAPIIVVRGPRQIGKTTAQLHVIDDLLARGVVPRRLMRVQVEDRSPIFKLKTEAVARLVGWFERNILGETLNEAAHRGEPAYLFLDEVQNVRDWDVQLKALVDANTVSVVLTGSSALRIEMGRDSLSGRISTIETGVLSLTEIAAFRGIDLGPPRLADNGLEPLLSPK